MIYCNIIPQYCSRKLKVIVCILMAIFIPVACDLGGIPNTKFVAIIIFGYVSKHVWKEDYPEQAFATFWSFIKHYLFGTLGASVLFGNLTLGMVGGALSIILVG